ncbi:amidohydrolase family protein [Chelativorans sp. Marseille-P2723]|uniref:amidohydrolase family protein n=1 Tax=Chelativorans sp. Marseille-P2723 TaxID=2709133 RepID=UPI00156DAAA2|nr:amidohydrolase family protein [Chelativorans sp. Marseille-P2723]
MIFDAHIHIWESWPYKPEVPDPQSRARAEQVLFEMDAAEVERAVVICAAIGDNPHNADYAFDAATRHAGRLVVFPDLECRWSPEFRTPGAANRLETALERWSFCGFTTYLTEEEDGSWLTGEEGRSFFSVAAEKRLIASLSVMPHQMPHVGRLAALFPELTLICHHMGFLGPRSAGTPSARDLVTALARHPNVFLKLSGMGNVAASQHEYPYEQLQWIFSALKEAFGPDRLVWGSDYPVSRRHMTYRQTLSLIRKHGPFCESELKRVLSGTMNKLIISRR